ncbi:MAG: acyl-CoA dehydrogenase family protein [Iamia sp.]
MAEIPKLADLTEVSEVVAAEAAAGEEAGRLTPTAVAALRDAGLFALHQPPDLGGLGLALPDACRVIAWLSEADGAAGWASMIGAGPAWFAGRMDPDGAAEVFGGGGAVAGSGQPGRAEPARSGAWRIEGRWRWCSGAPWAEWFTFNALDPDGGIVTVAVPAAEVTIHPETWDVRGLRATSSCDASVEGTVVPPTRAFRVTDGPPRRDEPVFRLGFEAFAHATMAAAPIGLARHAVVEAVGLAGDKTPTHGSGRLADDPLARRTLAASAAAVDAAAAGLERATAAVWDPVAAGGEAPPQATTALRLAAVHAATTGAKVAADLGALAGMSGLERSSALGRVLVDLPAASRNALLTEPRLAEIDPAGLPAALGR